MTGNGDATRSLPYTSSKRASYHIMIMIMNGVQMKWI
jgi:hypothetical protein